MVSLLKSALTNNARPSRASRRRTLRPRQRFQAEPLEARSLLSAVTWPGLTAPVAEIENNNTLDTAQNCVAVSVGHPAEVVGAIGTGSGASNDVDWYHFSINADAPIHIQSLPAVGSSVVLTLYGDALPAFDPQVPLGHQLLSRSEGTASTAAQITIWLHPGNYFVAVSGAGNRFSHPYLAGSGFAGTASNYGMSISASLPERAASPSDFPKPLQEYLPYEAQRSDDTATTATNLGTIASGGVLQVVAAIGDDPYYKVSSLNPLQANPAADVDLYHFQITDAGTTSLAAEVFAGRVGSALDPSLSLFRKTGTGSLQLVATNNNTRDPSVASNGTLPLYTDSLLTVGLTAGDYYLAVSGATNDSSWGTNAEGVFDPNRAHSGANGFSTGNYVLNLATHIDNDSPQVVGSSLTGTLNESPRRITVQFSEPVNLQQLASEAFLQTSDNVTRSVFVQASNGSRVFPRFENFDPASGIATFLMLDGLPSGNYELHLSGAAGLTDLAGHPLLGNNVSGDAVRSFSIQSANRGTNGNATTWTVGTNSDSTASPQTLGTLFPHELQNTVTLVRNVATAGGTDSSDDIRFDVLQAQFYLIQLSNTGNPAADLHLELRDTTGHDLHSLPMPSGIGLLTPLEAGSYVLHVGNWSSNTASSVGYRIRVNLGGGSENPTALATGAAPAINIQLVGGGPVGNQPFVTVFTGLSPASTSSSPSSSASVPTASNSAIAIPQGLLAGLNAPAIGSQGVTIGAPTNGDTAIVRLFGVSDRLFSLIDSSLLRPTTAAVTITRAELTESELLDLLKKSRSAAAEEADTTDTSADQEESADVSDNVRPTGSSESTPSNEAVSEPSQRPTQPLSRSRRTGLPTPSSRIESQTIGEQQPAAFSGAITLALATTLASTLRERSRRENDGIELATRRALAPGRSGG